MSRARAASVGGVTASVGDAFDIGTHDSGQITENPIHGGECLETFQETFPINYNEICPVPIALEKLEDTNLPLDKLIYQDKDTKAKRLKLETHYIDPYFPTDHPTHYKLPIGDLSRNEIQQPQRLVWKSISELYPHAEFIHENNPRPDDIVQGKLGDCWFLGALATLVNSPSHFANVFSKPWPAPRTTDTADIKHESSVFRFRFWKWGKWIEIAVDDRLPFLAKPDGTLQKPNQLAFASCKHSGRDFWVPLVEKAYAKLHGSYAALEAGSSADGMVDLTGGIVETIDMKRMGTSFKELPSILKGDDQWDYSVLWRRLKKASQRNFLVSCSNKSDYDPTRRYNNLLASSNGIITSHSYSISRILTVRVRNTKGINIFHKNTYHLIAVRNPWGEHSWNGAWSVESQEWKILSKSQRKKLGLTFAESGTFWISIEDFVLNFTHVSICRTVNTSLLSLHHQWDRHYFFGAWKIPDSAGGCINHATWYKNPQYRLYISKESMVIISLQQKELRLFNSLSGHDDELSIGFQLLHIETNRKTRIHIPMDSVDTKTNFINSRQITFARLLDQGTYMIIPCTYTPNHEGEYLLQIYTFCSSTCKQMQRDIPKKKIFHSRVKNALSVTVHRAYLQKMKGVHTSITPYVRVTVEGTEHKTICRANTNPQFDEGLLFYPKNPKKAVVKFEVYHSGVLLDTQLGHCSFPVSSIVNKQQGLRYSAKCFLYPKDPADSSVAGSILFSIYFHSHPELL